MTKKYVSYATYFTTGDYWDDAAEELQVSGFDLLELPSAAAQLDLRAAYDPQRLVRGAVEAERPAPVVLDERRAIDLGRHRGEP